MIKNKGSIISVFPEAVIYSNELKLNSEKIITYLNKLNFNKIKKEECVCYVSENFNILNEIPLLKKQIKPHIENYLYNIFNYKMDYKFLNSWVTKTNKTSFETCFKNLFYVDVTNK